VCAECHIRQAHQAHPAYEGQPRPPARTSAGAFHVPASAARLATTSTAMPHGPRYSVKTCGGCHYDQYQQWRSGAHFALAAVLPIKYASDATCQECHAAAGAAAARITSAASGEHPWVGATCENCHGPAYQHVRFVRQLIGPRRPGPQLEAAARAAIRDVKPNAMCVQCHLKERHQSHPQFEAVTTGQTP
jgi:hypothetical protein